MRTCLLLLLTILSAGCVASENRSSEVAAVPDNPGVSAEREAAIVEANRFLAEVDQGHIDEVWLKLSVLMTANIRLSDWKDVLARMHKDIGANKSRNLSEIGFTNGLADIPAGRYYVIHFRSEFERASALEELVVSLEEGVWKVGGYVVSDIERK